MALARTCSECGASLAALGPQAITCSNACRQKRRRRVVRENRRVREYQEHHNAADAEVAQIVRNTAQPEVAKVVSQELAPIVREAIDESVLRAIRGLLDLTPKAVEVLGTELEATYRDRDTGEEIPDQGRRSSAARTIMKYTVGHPALSPERQVGGLNVYMGIPQQDDEPAIEAAPEDAEELKRCDICGEEKPLDQFVADSDRCGECFHAWRKEALAKFHLEAGE